MWKQYTWNASTCVRRQSTTFTYFALTLHIKFCFVARKYQFWWAKVHVIGLEEWQEALGTYRVDLGFGIGSKLFFSMVTSNRKSEQEVLFEWCILYEWTLREHIFFWTLEEQEKVKTNPATCVEARQVSWCSFWRHLHLHCWRNVATCFLNYHHMWSEQLALKVSAQSVFTPVLVPLRWWSMPGRISSVRSLIRKHFSIFRFACKLRLICFHLQPHSQKFGHSVKYK